MLRMRKALFVLIGILSLGLAEVQAADDGWKKLPLIKDGKVDPSWVHVGYGRFIVDDAGLRTDPAPEGLGLLVYKKEKLGDCQVRVVFKPKEARSNSGVYVRIDDGILKQVNNPGAKFKRDEKGQPSDESMKEMQASGERDEGPWYAVHHGYEVQIAAGGDAAHGTASIYSLADSAAKGAGTPDWHTMIITLNGTKIDVELDGQHASSFDSTQKDVRARKIWHEPKREPKRPEKGYIGLQTHDPQDIVWFKEISVRPLPHK
jgi:hypothetical protein